MKVERVGGGDPMGYMTITVGSNLLASQRIEFTPGFLGQFESWGPFRIGTFEVPAGLARDAPDTEVRIDSAGAEHLDPIYHREAENLDGGLA